MLEQYLPFVGLIVFGNIENLVLSSQGVVAGVNPVKLGIASILCVSMWLIIGTFGTQILIDYVDFIDFIGGLAIFILGLQAMVQSIRGE
jgi:putative Mn2+ efflux pump MntP